MDLSKRLKNIDKEKEFLLCVDSDGCAINTMEYKHKLYFGPQMVDVWNLEEISEEVLKVWNHVNLYSKWRGINRFLALAKVFEIIKEKAELAGQSETIPDFSPLLQWIEAGTKLSNESLEKVAVGKDVFLNQVLDWSKKVNEEIATSKEETLPFLGVEESLKKAQNLADIVVISSANSEALDKEWNELGLAAYVKEIAGQEMGTKTNCIAMAKEGRYVDTQVLMVGDALGDLEAARNNGVLFYPIIPGKESMSWSRFYQEAFDKFIQGKYAGEYEKKVTQEFTMVLSDSRIEA